MATSWRAALLRLDVPVTAQTPGSAGNVQAGHDFHAGIGAARHRLRQQRQCPSEWPRCRVRRCIPRSLSQFLASRSRATPLAVGYAISCIQQGLNYTIRRTPIRRVSHGWGASSSRSMTDPAAPHQLCCPRSRPRSMPCGLWVRSSRVQPPTVTYGRRLPHHHGRAGLSQGTGPGTRRQRDQRLYQQPAHRRGPAFDQARPDRLLGKRGGRQCQCSDSKRQRPATLSWPRPGVVKPA